jgi:hypothetical protein
VTTPETTPETGSDTGSETSSDSGSVEVRRGWLPGRLSVLASRTGMAVLVVVAAGLITLVVVAVRGEPPPATLAQEAHQIATTLRCPICEDLSVADSPAPLAAQAGQVHRRAVQFRQGEVRCGAADQR